MVRPGLLRSGHSTRKAFGGCAGGWPRIQTCLRPGACGVCPSRAAEFGSARHRLRARRSRLGMGFAPRIARQACWVFAMCAVGGLRTSRRRSLPPARALKSRIWGAVQSRRRSATHSRHPKITSIVNQSNDLERLIVQGSSGFYLFEVIKFSRLPFYLAEFCEITMGFEEGNLQFFPFLSVL